MDRIAIAMQDGGAGAGARHEAAVLALTAMFGLVLIVRVEHWVSLDVSPHGGRLATRGECAAVGHAG
jgi:hypothetical protein